MRKPNKLAGCQVFNEKNVPEGWVLEPLGERIELAYGRALPEERRRPGAVVVYGSNGPVGSHSESFVVAPGVLVGRKGTVGAVHFAESDFWPIDTVYYVRALKGDDLRFIHYLLQYLPLERLNAATGVPGLSRRDAYALNGVFPLLPEQRLIAEVLARLDREISHVCADIVNPKALRLSIFAEENEPARDNSTSYASSLISLKTSLIDAIFSGRIGVSSLRSAIETTS
jgi:type I restriction enzyme S subunit